MQSQKWQNDLCSFPGKPFSITVIQVYAPTSNAEEAEVERFYEDLQDLLEITPKKHVLFLTGDWNAKVGSQEIPGVTGKFGLGIWNEAGQRLREFCQENTLVIANTLFQQYKRRLYTCTSLLLLLLSRFSYVRLCATPETAAHQASPSLGFSRQEHWSGLPFLSPMHESEKWSRSVVSDSSSPMDCSLQGSSVHGIF